jgi:multiple sugar transport system ATP-binding protein
MTAAVDLTEPTGSETYLYLTAPGSRLTARVKPDSPAAAGTRIRIGIDMARIHFFDAETEKTIP